VWLGGLASLVVWLRNRAPDETATNVAKRFSAVATLGLAAIVVTGVLRAIAEIGTVDALVATDFGRVVIAKSVLLLALAALGATNHFWNIPRGLGGLRLLRRIAPIELGLAAVVLLLSATLVNLAPPADASAQQLANAIVADGSDIATSVRAQLTASPGTVGLNEFSIVARDFDSGAALIPTAVTLRFSLPARADVGASRLDLAADSDGTFAASGANLSIDGTWRVVAIVTLPATAVEVPFDVTTRIVRQPVDVSRQPGLPTIYTIHLDAGVTVQAYVDPGTPGQDEVHATFFDASGTEMPVTSATMSLVSSSGAAIPLVPRILEPGHFVADATLDAGTYLLTVSAPAPDGSATLLARADVEVTP
jgi:copper transport protein